MTDKIQINSERLIQLFGAYDENLRLITDNFDVEIKPKENSVEIYGEEQKVQKATQFINKIIKLIDDGHILDKTAVKSALDLANMGRMEEIIPLSSDTVVITSKGKHVKCRTFGQKMYVSAIKKNTVTIGVGPAGTGKTYLAVAAAAAAFKRHEIERIILTRPAIEAGEKLGFLPGDLQMKVDPYLRPLYDALSEMFGFENYQKLTERGIIEVAPLAYMRGRTLNKAFIILDEAQNTTPEQMKMFLTRFGEGSKVIVNGDLTQTDLPQGRVSGLSNAIDILKGIEGIGIVKLTENDIVRHELVQKIVRAYDTHGVKSK